MTDDDVRDERDADPGEDRIVDAAEAGELGPVDPALEAQVTDRPRAPRPENGCIA